MRKLDESKINWIINQKKKGTANRYIAGSMGISVRHVQRIHARYLLTGTAPILHDAGRPKRTVTPDEVRAVLRAHKRHCCGAVYLERIL